MLEIMRRNVALSKVKTLMFDLSTDQNIFGSANRTHRAVPSSDLTSSQTLDNCILIHLCKEWHNINSPPTL